MVINESKFIESEVTFRDMSLSKEVSETRRSLVRWLALSLGVINPGESRLSAISVLDGILHFQFTAKKDPTVIDLSEYIEKVWGPINEKTLRYHLLQLKKSHIVKNIKGRYSISNDIGDRYDETVWINNYFDEITKPIKEKIILALKELKTK
ncbi:hypothetical protein M1614_03835 [Candidatus Marsarchaeota archaeon]|jgi:hypothetical protein|nr:hypothetical protein [Candidatus Marsarchaeota archaeon]MCL5089554.1 hypothetical protein [Candidatus Marsarchaeota archaeon]